MGVAKYERKQSKMEFISVAKELIMCTKGYGEKIGKRHKWLGVQQVFDYAMQVHHNIIMANSFNPKTDYEERTHYFKTALRYLNCISSGISILKEFTKKDKHILEQSQWEHWGILVATERKLIHGIMDYDKKSIKNIGE